MGGGATIQHLIQPSLAVEVPLTNEPVLDTYEPDVLDEATESISPNPSPGEASLRPHQPQPSESQQMAAVEYPATSNPPALAPGEEPISKEPVPSPAESHAIKSRIQRDKVISAKRPITEKADFEKKPIKSRPIPPVTDPSDSEQRSETDDMITSRRLPFRSTKIRAEPIRNIVPPRYKEPFEIPAGKDSSNQGIYNVPKAPITWNTPSEYTPDDNLSEVATSSKIKEPRSSISPAVLPASAMLNIENPAYRRSERILPQRAEERLSALVSPPPPPTIQVTIGRIEVRALPPQSPPVPRTTPRRRETILSLDEYLKGRNERQQ